MSVTNTSAMALPLFSEIVEESGDRNQRRAHDPDFDLHFLALSQLRGLGLSSIQALIEHYPDLGSIWQENPIIIREILHRARVPASQALSEEIQNAQPKLLAEGRALRDYLAQRNVRVLAATHPNFPRRLRDIPDAPSWLFVEGESAVLNAGTFAAVVGSRQASDLGIKTAEQVTWLAAQSGIGLVSGLAEGIDAAAHSMAARYRVPQVAVLGTGINITFPTSTATIRRQILDTGGCVITEYLPSDNYGKSRFVQRNRLQVGLSEAVCPVEGRSSSGTMHTVRFAGKYERTLFGVIREMAGTENEMPEILTKLGAPVFDLATVEGKTALRHFFSQLPGTRFPTPERPNPEFALRKILKAIDTVESYEELTHEQRVYVLDQVRRRLGLEDA